MPNKRKIFILVKFLLQRKILKVEPTAIKAVDQDIGINAPVRYSFQGGILPFITLNPETAELIIMRSLQEHELVTPATIVLKVKEKIK